MKKFKKQMVLVLVMLMVFGIVGCSSKDKTSEGSSSEKSEESKKTDTTDATQKADEVLEKPVVDMSETYDVDIFLWGPRDVDPEDEIIAHLNEKFNLNIKVERLLSKEYTQALELRIASGDMPDIFRYSSSKAHVYENLQEDDYLVNFSEYIEKFGYTDLASYLEIDGMKEFAEEDGFYQLASIKGPSKFSYIIREDWLEKVGMEKPTTLDELKAVLVAFKENKLGGENTIPLTFTYSFYGPVGKIITLFTGVNSWTKKDGAWTSEMTLNETRDALKLINEWYTEGLIDPEIFTQNETQTNAKIVNGSAGMIMTAMDRFPVTIKENLLASNPDAKLTMLVPVPAGPAGSVRAELTGMNNPMLVVKKGRDQAFLDRIMMLTDYIHSEEGISVLVNGIEGIHYTMDGDKMITTEAYDRDIIPGIGNMLAMFTDYSSANGNFEGIEKENYDDIIKMKVVSPFEMFRNEVTQDVLPSVQTIYDQYMIEFITGAKDLNADWNEYVEEINDIGLSIITEEVNKYAAEKGIE